MKKSRFCLAVSGERIPSPSFVSLRSLVQCNTTKHFLLVLCLLNHPHVRDLIGLRDQRNPFQSGRTRQVYAFAQLLNRDLNCSITMRVAGFTGAWCLSARKCSLSDSPFARLRRLVVLEHRPLACNLSMEVLEERYSVCASPANCRDATFPLFDVDVQEGPPPKRSWVNKLAGPVCVQARGSAAVMRASLDANSVTQRSI